jgi:hypothetical protein
MARIEKMELGAGKIPFEEFRPGIVFDIHTLLRRVKRTFVDVRP